MSNVAKDIIRYNASNTLMLSPPFFCEVEANTLSSITLELYYHKNSYGSTKYYILAIIFYIEGIPISIPYNGSYSHDYN